MVSTPRVGILAGPTATGKSQIALEFALARPKTSQPIEIVNADSLLVYRRMNIGTAKPTPQERAQVPHHLIDIRDPGEPFTAGEFVRAAQDVISDIHGRGARALVVGGTGFYLKALLYGLWDAPAADPQIRATLSQLPEIELHASLEAKDPLSAARIGRADKYRLVRALELFELTGKTPTELQKSAPAAADPQFALWVADRPDSVLRERIAMRSQAMLEAGLVDEVKTLRQQYPESRALLSIGYAQTIRHLDGKFPAGRKPKAGVAGLRDEIELATRQLVKAQRTWFRGQSQAKWFKLDDDLPALGLALREVYGD